MKEKMAFARIIFLVFSGLALAQGGVAQTAKTKRAIQTPLISPGRESRPVALDERIRMINYNPNEVVQLRGAYGFSMTVEFAEDEVVSTISVGDSVAWQIIPKRNILFLKPQEEKPETNMLVMTNKRNYSFSLLGFKPNGVGDPRLTYRVLFRYPEEEERKLDAAVLAAGGMVLTRELKSASGGAGGGAEGVVDIKALPPKTKARSPTEFNLNYSFKGSKFAAPLQMFDDGEFTYVRFADTENVPAIFSVDSEKRETLINYRREGNWLVIERISRQFLFRANNNADIACVFNEGYPQRPASSVPEKQGS